MIRTRRIGVIAGGLAALAALQGLVSCGDSFGDDDCRLSRTCPDSGGEPGQGGGDSSNGGGADATAGGSNGTGAGQAGAGGNDPTAESFRVVAISPRSDALEVELDASIVISFSKPLDATTVTPETVQILDGETEVVGDLAYADGEVTFTPTDPLLLLVDYSVQITTELTDVDGVALTEEFASAFTTRDGVWHAAVVATDTYDESRPKSIPIAANGDTLLTWPVLNGESCSITAAWFNRGESLGVPQEFSTTVAVDICYRIGVDANADGVASLISGGYQIDAEQAVTGANGAIHEFRSGEWKRLGSLSTDAAGIGVGHDGAISYIAQAFPGTSAYMSTDNGIGADVRSIGDDHWGLGIPTIVFDINGDGWAAWQAETPGVDPYASRPEQLLVARYTVDDGWEEGSVLPGSLAPSALYYDRGEPALAVDDAGGAMVVWVRGGSTKYSGELVASRYTADGGWEPPTLLSGQANVVHRGFAPALVFDGEQYVAAWPGDDGGSVFLFTARYDLGAEDWGAAELQSETTIVDAMPRLGADAHRNLLLTWLAPRPGGRFLMYSRYRASTSEWSEAQPITDESVGAANAAYHPSPLGVAPSGLGALIWAVAPDFGEPATVYYASFH